MAEWPGVTSPGPHRGRGEEDPCLQRHTPALKPCAGRPAAALCPLGLHSRAAASGCLSCSASLLMGSGAESAILWLLWSVAVAGLGFPPGRGAPGAFVWSWVRDGTAGTRTQPQCEMPVSQPLSCALGQALSRRESLTGEGEGRPHLSVQVRSFLTVIIILNHFVCKMMGDTHFPFAGSLADGRNSQS